MYRFILFSLGFYLLVPHIAHSSPVLVSGEDWFALPHPKVLAFEVDEYGNASGFVEGDIPFRQYTIFEEEGVRVQRFELLDHFHFIVNGQIVYTFDELSVLLAQAHNEMNAV